MNRQCVLVAAALLSMARVGAAHEVRPASLELVEVAPARYEVIWKQPLAGETRLRIDPVLPAECGVAEGGATVAAGGLLVERFELDCSQAEPSGLEGRILGVAGLERTLTDVLVRVRLLDGRSWVHLLKPVAPEWRVGGPGGAAVLAYLRLGVEHLVFGIDHVLFVLGLLLLVRRPIALVQVITAFTVAHSVTLALSATGRVRLPQAPVEAVIALSILFLAVELEKQRRGGELGLAGRSPWVVAFAFGLLHGFGFAGALAEIGLPRGDAALALLLFNVGVELGQLAIVALALGLVFAVGRIMRRRPATFPWWARALPIFVLGTLSASWFWARVAAI
ncbi:MAG TPA: HupE/UreJ family protein [Thermoanaerobaculia bacterium]|nr:HupE/UreJ family protein [Thermoanaerobaculia bacterium]